MAKVIPVGPIDPVLYAFAKKEAEKAERNPRYAPKNCPADRGQIIYKRIGNAVKALVITHSFQGNYHPSTRSSIPIFDILDGADGKIAELSEVDGSGNKDEYTTLSPLSYSTYRRREGFYRLDNLSAGIKHYGRTERSLLFVGTGPSVDYWQQTITVTGSDEEKVEFYQQFIDEEGVCGLKMIGSYSADIGNYKWVNFAAGWSNAYWDHIRIRDESSTAHEIVSAGIKGEDYWYVVATQTNTVSRGPGLIFGSGRITQEREYKISVNGSLIETISGPYFERTYTYGPYGGTSEDTNDEREWRIGASLLGVARCDAGGLCYLLDTEFDPPMRRAVTPTRSGYSAIANRFGVFLVDLTADKLRPRIIWVKPKELDSPSEDQRLRVRRLLHNTKAATDGDYETNSVAIIINLFGEDTSEGIPGEGFARGKNVGLITRTKSPNDVIFISMESGEFVDLTDLITRHALGEITEDEVRGWRTGPKKGAAEDLVFRHKKLMGEYPQEFTRNLIQASLMAGAEKKIIKKAHASFEQLLK